MPASLCCVRSQARLRARAWRESCPWRQATQQNVLSYLTVNLSIEGLLPAMLDVQARQGEMVGSLGHQCLQQHLSGDED